MQKSNKLHRLGKSKLVIGLILISAIGWLFYIAFFPGLLAAFPDYPNGQKLELLSLPENLRNFECSGFNGAFAGKSFQIITTSDNKIQIMKFYYQYGADHWLTEISGRAWFKPYVAQDTLCFIGYGGHIRPALVFALLDSANPDDAEALKITYPEAFNNHKFVIMTFQGYVSTE